jgi:hypothetical protein
MGLFERHERLKLEQAEQAAHDSERATWYEVLAHVQLALTRANVFAQREELGLRELLARIGHQYLQRYREQSVNSDGLIIACNNRHDRRVTGEVGEIEGGHYQKWLFPWTAACRKSAPHRAHTFGRPDTQKRHRPQCGSQLRMT